MSQGVAPAFLEILDDDRRIAARRSGLMLAVALALFAAAWFLWSPWGLLVHAAAVGIGALLGLLLSRAAHRRYEAGLTEAWVEWMDAAPGSRSVPEVARRVAGRSATGARWVLVAIGVALVEAALVTLAVQEDAGAIQALPALLWQGIMTGALWIHPWRVAAWRRTFSGSLQEMIDDGELTVEA